MEKEASGVGTSVPYGSGLIYQTMKPDKLKRSDKRDRPGAVLK